MDQSSIETEFIARLAAFAGDATAAQALGRWTALSRPELQFVGSVAAIEQAVAVEQSYYRVGDGDAPMETLIAAIVTAQATLVPMEPEEPPVELPEESMP